MNLYFRNTGNKNTGVVGNWSTSSGGPANASRVPNATDRAIFNGLSGPAVINTALIVREVVFTGFTKDIAMTRELIVTGDGTGADQQVILSPEMTFSGTANIFIKGSTGTNKIVLASNDKAFPNDLVFSNTGSTLTLTLSQAFSVANVILSGSNSSFILSGETLKTRGDLEMSASSITGGIVEFTGAGTWSSGGGTLGSYVIFNAAGHTIVVSGTVIWSGSALTYTGGEVVTTGSTLSVTGAGTFYTSGMSWNNVSVSAAGTVTVSSALNVLGTFSCNSLGTTFALSATLTAGTMTLSAASPSNSTIFSGTAGFTVTNLNLNTAGMTLTLSDDIIYRVNGLFTATAGTSISPITLTCSHATNQAIFNVLGEQAANIFVNATRIDSSGGIAQYSFGTLTQTINWNSYSHLISENMDYTINGKITSTNSEYFTHVIYSNLIVKIYKVLFNTEPEYLESTTVNSDGTFSKTISTAANAILVRLYINEGSELLLAESDRFCRHDKIEINFNVSEHLVGETIYNKIMSRLAAAGVSVDNAASIAALTDVNLSQLEAMTCISLPTLTRFKNANRIWAEFVTFEAPLNLTGVYEPADVAAHNFVSNPGTSAAFARGRKLIFALIKDFPAFTLGDTFTFSFNQFKDRIAASIALREIEAGLDAEANLLLLVGSRNALLFNADDDGRNADAKLIHLADVPANVYTNRSNLLNDALEHGGLSGNLTDSPSAAAARPLATLNSHLGSFAPFVKIAAQHPDIGAAPDYHDITTQGPAFWSGKMGGLSGALPEGYASTAEYANAIYENISRQYPSARMAYGIQEDSNLSSGYGALTETLRVNPGFDVSKQAVSQYFTRGGSGTNPLVADKFDKLQTLQRLYKLSGDDGSLLNTGLLVSEGYFSASSIIDGGKDRFLLNMGTAGLTVVKAKEMWCYAKSVYDTVVGMAVHYKRFEERDSFMPSVIKENQLSLPGDAIDENELPNMTAMFGSVSTCQCKDCQSIYSPAAYLTDMLSWLEKDVLPLDPNNDPNGLDALEMVVDKNDEGDDEDDEYFFRRRDIRYILLSCKNTNTLVPYIDIVNEILSVNLHPDLPGFPADLPGQQADMAVEYEKLQTRKTASEVRIEPENRFPSEEDLLLNYNYPWMLPYSVPYDQVVSYLRASTKDYHELINDFSKETSKYAEIRWAQAFLNINNNELSMFTTNNAGGSFWKNYWGLDVSGALNVAQIEKVSGLSYEALNEILTARYIQQDYSTGQKINITPAGDLCNVEGYNITQPFTEPTGDMFMKFLRLKRKTGLSTWELDVAIQNLGSGAINNAFLQKLAGCLSFARDYHAEFSEVLMLTGNNSYRYLWNTAQFSTYYNSKFQNSLLHKDVRDYFSLTAYTNNGNRYATDVKTLATKDKQYLSIVLKSSIPAIDSIVDYITGAGIIGGGAVSFTTSELSLIHRYSAFLNFFKLEPSELEDALVLFGDIFSAGNVIKAAYDFAESLRQFRMLDIALAEFRNLTEGSGQYSTASGTALEKKAERSWEAAEKAFQEARKANTDKSAADPIHAGFYKAVVVNDLALQFNLADSDVEAIIDEYDSTWLGDFITDPDGTGTSREWSNKDAGFAPLYQLLNRIVAFAALFDIEMREVDGLQKQSLVYGIETEFPSPTMDVPGAPFFWLTDSFAGALTSASMKDLVWLKRAARQAELLDMPQREFAAMPVDFYTLVDDYKNNHAAYATAPYTKTHDAYKTLGANSPYKKLSVYEFTEIFIRARAIAPVTADIVSVLDAFEVIYNDIKVFNIKVVDAWAWVWTSAWSSGTFTPSTVNRTLAADIKRTLNNKFPAASGWSNFIVPVENDLREHLRDALVGLYVGHKGFDDEHDLYSYYLLDTQMASCADTSRIVAAMSSVQLLVHRALMGLEKQVPIDEEDKREWEWRKNYRVWEANRKVFLYPENWIDPALRQDKTRLFKDAEEFLQQDEINDRNTDQAFANYLTTLGEVARLNVMAVFIEREGDITTPPDYDPNEGPGEPYHGYIPDPDETMHVIARTWNPPYIHYYRQFEDNVWSEWEKIEVEINSEHIIPVIFNRKLHIFFPIFTEKMYTKDPGTGAVNSVEARPYYEIQMAYTKLDYGRWSQKKVLNGALLAGNIALPEHPNEIAWLDRMVEKPGDNGKTSWGGTLQHGIWITDYEGNLNWTNSAVSMRKEDFFFWGELQPGGDLEIKCRRAHDPKYYTPSLGPISTTDYAYERGFRIAGGNETVKIIEAYATDIPNTPRLLARPYWTMPHSQQLRGYAGVLRVRKKNYDSTYIDADVPMLDTNAYDYVLTFPHQYKHSLSPQPFFYGDNNHSLFFQLDTATNRYQIFSNEHPYVNQMLTEINVRGVQGLLNPPTGSDLKRQQLSQNYFPGFYTPNGAGFVGTYPKSEFDFNIKGPYSLYNWEVFFHMSSLMARQLRLNNKFAEAMKWLNYIFDPSEPDDLTIANQLQDLRYWQIKPFFQNVSSGSIRKMMRLLSMADNTLTPDELAMKQDYTEQVRVWRKHPFDPHYIAAMRPRAYMLWTVMEYVTLLTDWGDYLFRQDTMESINEATNLYVIASEILGQRPADVSRPDPADRSYDDIAANLSVFSNVITEFENYLPSLSFCSCTSEARYPVSSAATYCSTTPTTIKSTDLLFCIPGNPKIVEMWNRVDDRLFKIRHCMNIDGKVRSLALFSPPIDPAMLVQAAAGGLSIEDALADLAAPLPHYRFSYLLQKANEFCGEVKGLGSQLIGLLEKKDAEELALFRQVHEQNILKATRALKEMAIEEAKQAKATLESSKNLIQLRLDDYKNREYINNREDNAIRQSRLADGFMYAESGARLVAGLLSLVPDFEGGVSGVCASPVAVAKLFGGSKMSAVANAAAGVLGIISAINRNAATMSNTYASYDRRQEEWNLQIKSATEELAQVDRQLLGSDIRISVTEKELVNHDLQVEQAEEMYNWLKDKYTNARLYSWMIGQIKTVYRQAFDLAYNMAKKAQVCYEYELGASSNNIIQYGQWDSTRSGLLAGERLSLQLRRLETEYIKNNEREYEITRNISLMRLDPLAMEQLKATGKCTIQIPDALFILDYPGHYFRRIKTVSISIPCIAGTQTNINATLTLNKHAIRTSDTDTSPLSMQALPPESIATSSAQNDSGVFELNFKDERYLPFEGRGAVSEWGLELTDTYRQFDYSSIADVVIHMKYTAKDAGSDGVLGTAMKAALNGYLNTLEQALGETQMHYAFSMRHDMPNEWHEFKRVGIVNFSIAQNRLPYFMQALNPDIADLSFVATNAAGPGDLLIDGSPVTLSLIDDATDAYYGVLGSSASFGAVINLTEDSMVAADMEDLVVVAKLQFP